MLKGPGGDAAMNYAAEDFSFISELDDEQRAAVMAEKNAVVSAGAGSGKTRVISARYGWLIMTGRCELDQILTITFTNKAANEMYRRIYATLSAHAASSEYARKAVENFHKARISTLDSFCSVVARTVCRRFGISPNFESDDIRVRELARSLALRFVLDKRNDPALQQLIAEKKMRHTADELFVRPVLRHSTVSSPLDFNRFEKIQREEICERWKDLTRSGDEQIALILEMMEQIPARGALYEHLSAMLPRIVKAPDMPLLEDRAAGKSPQVIVPRDALLSYLEFLSGLKNYSFRGNIKNEAILILRDVFKELKDIHTLLEALANSALQWDIVQAVFPLMAEYQEILNAKKREAGILTFNDIAHLAVDGLRRHEDIRRMYRESFTMIMIDEFQDNNSLQRDLVDLLAQPGSAGVFYVGDEKQSIYRFRGADVSVFRSLAEQAESRLSLNRNYRSHPALIRAFNLIFGGYRHENDPDPLEGIFPPEGAKTETYQAVYRWIKTGDDTAGCQGRQPKEIHQNAEAFWIDMDVAPRLHFAFFDKGRLEPDDSLSADDHEAAFIANSIQAMMKGKKLYDKDSAQERPCSYGDFAVLLRSHTHQHSLERVLKLQGIPFSADRPAALFNDAPVNDLWAFLKLLVYPGDRIAYGALLRSPFVRLSNNAFTLCMLRGGPVFDEPLDQELPPPDRRRYREARGRYRELLLDARDLPVSSLITRLWYAEGYRHEALWSAAAQSFLDLYDLFFEQARIIEERGGGLVDFLDFLDDLVNRQEKPDDSTLPDEEGGVRIMTIHHAKGLEFPVVFVFGCGNTEKTSLEPGLAHFSERRGIFLRLPQSEEFPESEDYFALAEKQEHRDKTEAELRRLLYVAMTRAEQELYVTAVIPEQNQKEREALSPEMYGGYGKEFITRRLEQFRTKPDVHSLSFLRLLPRLDGDNPLYTVEAIDRHQFTMQRKSAAESLEEAALRVRPDYEAATAVPPFQFVPQTVSASSLHVQAALPGATPQTVPAPVPQALPGGPADSNAEALDILLEQTGMEAKEFGLLAHSFIEALFNGEKPALPSRFTSSEKLRSLAAAAQALAEGFFNSPLGRRAASAAFRKTEYPVLTAVEGTPGSQETPGRIVVSGIIDLLFEDGDTVYVVDFKTDRDEDITRHTGQLAIYKRAAEDIFGKPVKCRLFYLRTGHEADLDEAIGKTSPEELLAQAAVIPPGTLF
jgi:ATP-dependent helicase/nuclease subunit A